MTAVETKPQLETIEPGLAGPRVVALGGGHGLACTLKAVKEYASEITAIVAVGDDGGSSGRLTSGLGVPPPGDVRRCLLALAPEGSIWADLFAHRFSSGDIEDHSLGNLLLAALTDITGDFATGVDVAGQILNIVGKVVPAAIEPAELRAVAGGREVVGQAAITKVRDIETMSLGPESLIANPKAVEAIRTADQLILGPGSLYTSLIAVLLVPGIADAWRESMARKYFILNLIDQDGETLGMTGADHVRVLASLAGVGGPGVIVAHTGELDLPADHSVVSIDRGDALGWGWDVVAAELTTHGVDWPEHDYTTLSRILRDSG